VSESTSHPDGISGALTLLFAVACGLIVANLYYAQPLAALIAPSIGLAADASGLTVTLTQTGYCLGLILLVPLGDLTENRRLICISLIAACASLAAAALAPSAAWFLSAAFCVGLSSVAVQMLVPVAAHLAPEQSRGRVVGNVMAGLLTGIMLSRPASSIIASEFGWRVVYASSALLMAILAVVLRLLLPERQVHADHSYGELIGSLWRLLYDTSLLQRRAAYQAALFGAFSLYWTAVPLLLLGPAFGLSQRGISLFALAGAAGAFSAPLAGRLADRGHTRIATGIALALAIFAFALASLGARGSLVGLLAGGILLDLAVQGNVVLGQRAIFSLGAEVRSRLNGLYLAIFFGGGALGSALASFAFEHGGWPRVCEIGIAFPSVGLLVFMLHLASDRRSRNQTLERDGQPKAP
jgi:predicted MFS family arabinose efflux permease